MVLQDDIHTFFLSDISFYLMGTMHWPPAGFSLDLSSNIAFNACYGLTCHYEPLHILDVLFILDILAFW